MNHSFVRSALLCFLLILAGLALARPHTQASGTADRTTRSAVLVELFTSEGCSSCPPAEALLAKLAENPPAENVQVIALEEHVDYWNGLGWSDPFSSPDWTARQYAYSGALRSRNPYTPQMVVDGNVEFVGSHAQKALQTILGAAGRTKSPVTLLPRNSNHTGSVNFSVQVGKLAAPAARDTAQVWLAITETALHSAVKGGENAGRELRHAAVVRTLRKIGEAKPESETAFSGDADVPLQKEWKRENLKAVVFVQEKKSRQILGAAEIRVAP